ncbi:MAG: tRNA (adenosine(37)-N6)-dimethylallyltransferase MiaA [Lentimicrobium sp.]|nr:tRNA (adenosine(37)-N6)-dimethylallyltransferase MiaA [Lentimicrobium sp.]
MPEAPLLVVIAGPTAVGKTSVAIDVASNINCDIISADSRQFYKELKIGTAAPTQEQLNLVKHHFIGQLSLTDPYDVSKYEAEVLELLPRLFEKTPVVILTGGSGLYVHAVCEGLDDLPDSNPLVREELRKKYDEEGIASIRAMLRQLDPEYYSRVDLANPNRLLRALEVCLITGKPFTSFRKKQANSRNFNMLKIGLDLPRNDLHNRINARVDKMIADGLLREAENFFHLRHLNALNTVGYKELFAYFNGLCSLNEAIEKIKTNTRRYARRQITWFRRDKEMIWIRPDSGDVFRLLDKYRENLTKN